MKKHNTRTDYKKCIANIPNSILKYFGAEPAGDTLPLLDDYLDGEYRNIIVLVINGMGSSVTGWNMEHGNPVKRHHKVSICSVFPAAPAAAQASLMSGLQPCGHARLGNDAADEPAPYKSVFDRLGEAGVKSYCISPENDPDLRSFQDVLDRAKSICSMPERKYIYASWPYLEPLLCRCGGGSGISEEVRECLTDIENRIVGFTEDMKDTLLVITADHGHTDVETSDISDHPELLDCLERMPSFESRMLMFFVKDGRESEFCSLFNEFYGEDFKLLTKKDALDEHLFGTGAENGRFRSMLGDYIAVATDGLSIVRGGDKSRVSGYGGISEDEIYVPFIVFRDFFFLGTDADAYVDEALRRLRNRYPWAVKSMFDKHESYSIEENDGRKEFVNYYTWDDNENKRYAEGWDGEFFIRKIINDNESWIERANEVSEVFDVRPDQGADCHGWCLERFEFRSHKLGGYSAFVQAGDRCTGGSRTFFFTPEQMSGTFEDFLESNAELLSGRFGLDADYMRQFKGLKEFLGFKE